MSCMHNYRSNERFFRRMNQQYSVNGCSKRREVFNIDDIRYSFTNKKDNEKVKTDNEEIIYIPSDIIVKEIHSNEIVSEEHLINLLGDNLSQYDKLSKIKLLMNHNVIEDRVVNDVKSYVLTEEGLKWYRDI